MKKVTVVLVLIIILGGSGMPVLNGMIMEKKVRQTFEAINQGQERSGSGNLFEIVRYDRRFLSSEIEWKMISQGPANIFGAHEIIFIDRVAHGMIGISTETSLEKNPWFTDLVSRETAGKNPLSIQTQFNYSGKMKSVFVLDAVSFTGPGGTFDIKPGRADLSIDRGRGNTRLNLNFEGLDNAGKKPVISKLKFDYELFSHPEEGTISMKAQASVESLHSEAGQIKNISGRIHINQMDAGGYKDLMAVFREGLADVAGKGPAAWQDVHAVETAMEGQIVQKGFAWIEICQKLLKKGTEIELLGFNAQLPQGDMAAEGKIRIEKDLPPAGVIPLMLMPSKTLDYISLNSYMILPGSLNPDQRFLTPFSPGFTTGLFIMEHGRLTHRLETREGRLFLNQQEVLLN